MGLPVHRPTAALFASLVLLGGAAFGDTPQRVTAILVEIRSMQKCVGLDCPPWPVPDDSYFCFQAGNNFYTGAHLPWGVPWAKQGKKLQALKGKTIEIAVTDEHIKVVAPRINLRLKRVHDLHIFQLDSCSYD
jgi:hypothetical protein